MNRHHTLRPLGLWMAGTVLVLQSSCLYTGPIGVPPENEEPPRFINWLPQETSVEVDEKGAEFSVAYTDPDASDIPLLQLEWRLDSLDQGNGTKITIWPQDLAPDGTAVLVAKVTDPSGESDYLVWNLTAKTPNSGE